jgi:putative membrane protein
MDRVQVVTSTSPGSSAPLETAGVVPTILVYLVVGLILALVNTVIKPVLKILAFPLYILTLGLFGLVVNGFMLLIVTKVTPVLGFGLQVSDFSAAVIAAIVLSILTALVSIPFKDKGK